MFEIPAMHNQRGVLAAYLEVDSDEDLIFVEEKENTHSFLHHDQKYEVLHHSVAGKGVMVDFNSNLWIIRKI